MNWLRFLTRSAAAGPRCSCGEPVRDSMLEFWCSPICWLLFQQAQGDALVPAWRAVT